MEDHVALESLARSLAIVVDGEIDYWPEYERKDIAKERVIVVPSGIAYKHLSRVHLQTDYLMDVGILRRTTEDDVPALVKRVQRMGRALVGRMVGNFRCVDVKYDPLYSVEHLRERRQFTAVLKLTFRTVE